MWIWTWGCRSHKTVVLKVHMMINHWIHVRQFNSQINLSGGGPANFLGQFLDVRVSRFHDHHVWWLRGGDILSRSTYQACSEPSISLVVKFRCTNVGFFFRIEASRYVLTIFFFWGRERGPMGSEMRKVHVNVPSSSIRSPPKKSCWYDLRNLNAASKILHLSWLSERMSADHTVWAWYMAHIDHIKSYP